MIRTYLHLDVADGQSGNLVRAFKDLRILETSVEEPGCLSAELTLSEDGRQAIVTATWDSVGGYTRWTSSPDRASYAEVVSQWLAAPLGPDSTGKRFTVAHSAVARTGEASMRGES